MTEQVIVRESQHPSPGIAYLLWCLFFIGFAGIHRFYCGRWVTGLLWLFTGPRRAGAAHRPDHRSVSHPRPVPTAEVVITTIQALVTSHGYKTSRACKTPDAFSSPKAMTRKCSPHTFVGKTASGPECRPPNTTERNKRDHTRLAHSSGAAMPPRRRPPIPPPATTNELSIVEYQV